MSLKCIEISTQQRLHTLAAKSRRPSQTLKTVLKQPYLFQLPQLSTEDGHHFVEMLRQIQNVHPTWFSEKKLNYSKKPIRFGLRESIKNLKSANTRLVAISPDIKPRYVVNRIILRAVANNKGIDVICLPSMDILIQKLLGFSCFALVITENQSHEFDELLNWCHKILIVYRETPSLNQSVFSKQCFRKRNGPDNSYQNRHRVSNEDNGLNLNQFYLPSEDVILGQRAFHPVNSAHSKPLDLILKPLNQIRSGFIQLDTFDATGTVTIVPNLKINQKQHKKANKNKYMEKSIDLYQPLTIHKIQQNPRKTECSGKQMEGRKKRLSKHFQGADTTD